MARECLRVEQIDAQVLDSEYRQLAISQIESTLEGLPVYVSRALEKVKPEIELAVDSVLWSTCLTQGASPGQIEEDIAFKDYPLKKIASHFGLSVLLPYISRRVPEISGKPAWTRMVAKLEAIYEIFAILHYLRFLSRGGHSNLVESALGLRNWNNDLPTIGTINYESQNRELLWHAFRDGLLLGYPFFSYIHRYWKRTSRGIASTNGMNCGACGKTATIPVRWSCGHSACYWCDASRKESGCVVCGLEEKAQIMRGKLVKKEDEK